MKEDYVLNKVTQLRNERKWTLYRLAKEADISYSTLNNTFHRNNVPSVSTLIRICEGFGITLAEFFNESDEVPRQLTIAERQILADWHRLPRDERGLVMTYMQGLRQLDDNQ